MIPTIKRNRIYRRSHLIAAVVALASAYHVMQPGHAQEKVPSATATLSPINISLPAKTDSIYRLGELAQILSQASQRTVAVDKRCEERKLLVLVPTGKMLTAAKLQELMALSTGLKWRTVGTTDFLSIHEPDAVANALRQKMNELRAKRGELLDKVGGAIPVTSDELNTRAFSWDQLSDTQRQHFLNIANQATGPEGEQLRNALQNPASMHGARIGFIVDVIVRGKASGFDGSAAHVLIQ